MSFQQSDWLSDSYYVVIFTALPSEHNPQPFVLKNKMAASRFAQVSNEEISKRRQTAMKYGVKLFKGKPAFCLELNYFMLKLKSFGKLTEVSF